MLQPGYRGNDYMQQSTSLERCEHSRDNVYPFGVANTPEVAEVLHHQTPKISTASNPKPTK
jgi:hypothetical protein